MSAKRWLKLTILMCALTASQSFFNSCGTQHSTSADTTTTSTNPTIDAAAKSILQLRCAACHGENGSGDGGFTSLDVESMTLANRLVPGSPEYSLIYTRIIDQSMPTDSPLPASESDTIRQWIIELGENAGVIRFPEVLARILQPKCLSCHGPSAITPLNVYSSVILTVVPGAPRFSLLYETAISGVAPHDQFTLEAEVQELLADWITQGALN